MRRRAFWVTVWLCGVVGLAAALWPAATRPVPWPPGRLFVATVPGTHLAVTEPASGVHQTGPVEVWDLDSGRQVRSIPAVWVGGVYHSPTATCLVCGTVSDVSVGYDLATGRELFRRPAGAWFCPIAGPDGWLLAEFHPAGLHILDPPTGRVLRTLPGDGSAIGIRTTGRFLATRRPGPGGDRLTVWDAWTGQECGTIPAAERPDDERFLSADGRSLVEPDGTVRDVATGRPRFTLGGGDRLPTPDGLGVVTLTPAADRLTARRFDLLTGAADEWAGPLSLSASVGGLPGQSRSPGAVLTFWTETCDPPHAVHRLLARLPGLAALGGPVRSGTTSVFDPATGRVKFVAPVACDLDGGTGDGEVLFFYHYGDDLAWTWHRHPGFPGRSAAAVAGWTLALLGWRLRSRRAGSH